MMMDMVNEKFKDQYDYFYLPKDVKTQCGVGYAFINFLSPLFILDFFLEFNCIKWSDKLEKCNSTKYCEITYANMQGIEEIRKEYSDKNVMKKMEEDLKPQFFENLVVDPDDLTEIEEKYKNNSEHYNFYTNKLKTFEIIKKMIQEQKNQLQIQKDIRMAENKTKMSKKQKKKQMNEKQRMQNLPPSEYYDHYEQNVNAKSSNQQQTQLQQP